MVLLLVVLLAALVLLTALVLFALSTASQEQEDNAKREAALQAAIYLHFAHAPLMGRPR